MKESLAYDNQYLIDLEHEFHLPERRIYGVYLWKLIRFSVARNIEMARGCLEQSPKRQTKKPIWKQLIRFLRSFNYCYTKPRVILYEHSRKVEYNSTFVDPYSFGVTQTLENANAQFCLLEDDLYYQSDLSDTRRWFLIRPQMGCVKFDRLKRPAGEELQLIRTLERRIESDLGVRVDLAALVLFHVNKFKKEYAYFLERLRNKGIKVMFLICGYGKEGVVQAAKDAGVYTVELQHGNIFPLHMGYAYPGWNRVPYFADSIALYSESWLEGISLPGIDTRVIGHAPVPPVSPVESESPKETDLLFISQWTHSEQILAFADQVAQRMPTRKVVCKLHPSDAADETVGARYPNISVRKDGLLSTYLRDSKYVATVYSTGIYESLRYGCRPILLDMHGVKHMESFVRVTGAPIVPDPAVLARFIETDEQAGGVYRNLNYDCWFSEFDPSVVLDYISSQD